MIVITVAVSFPNIFSIPLSKLASSYAHPQFQEIDDYLSQLSESVDGELSVVYIDLTSHTQIAYNGDQEQETINTLNVAAAITMTDWLAEGTCKPEKRLYFDESDDVAMYSMLKVSLNTGVPYYQISQLVTYAVRHADPISTNMLIREVGDKDFRKHVYTELLSEKDIPKTTAFSTTDSAEIMAYLYDHRSEYPSIFEHLQTNEGVSLLATDTTKKATAYLGGQYEQYSYDSAIVLQDAPYVLVVYTQNVEDSAALVSQIADDIWQIQSTIGTEKK